MRILAIVVGVLTLLLVVLLETSAWRERRARRKSRLDRVIWFCALLLCTWPTFAGEGKPDRSWPWTLGAYSVGVGADAWTTSRGLQAGAREGNPAYSWAGRDGAAPLRLAIGAWTAYRLDILHRTHPKAARRLTWTLTALSLAVAYHNRGVERQQEDRSR